MNDRARKLRTAVVVVLAIAGLVMFVVDGAKLYRKTLRPGLNDFEMFHEGARRALAGEDVLAVEGWGYPYLPTFYAVMAPLGLLPLGAAAIAWHTLKGALLAAVFAALWKLLDRAGFQEQTPIAIALTAIGILRPLDSDLPLGQSNVVVLALITAAIYAYLTHRDEIAGLGAALAALFKVTPALLLVFFAWKRRWRVAGWAAIGVVLFGGLLPAAVFGPRETVRLYGEFHARLIRPQLEGTHTRDADGSMPGQSLAPVLHRWITPVTAVDPGQVGGERIAINVVTVDERTAGWIARAAQVALFLALLWFTRPSGEEVRRAPRALLELGLVVTIMLLMAPYARKAHFVALAIPFAACGAYALRCGCRGLQALVVLAALIPLAASPGLFKVLGAGRTGHIVNAYGPYTAAALLLAIASIVAIRRERGAESSAAAGPGPTDLEVSVFFPAYNEGQNIGAVVERALAVLPKISRRYEVIVVDDASKDDTPAVVGALAARHPDVVRHVRHPQNRGYGGAVKTGLASARYPLVFFSDGDGQFDLNELPGFCRPLARVAGTGAGVDAVIGYRRKRRDPFLRLVNAYCWGALVRTLFGIPARDIDCAYKILPTALVHRLDLKAEGALISTEILAKLDRAGCRTVERPVTHLPRERGAATGANPRVILRAFKELFRFRRELARFRLP